MADEVGTTLAQVTAALPGGGESRQGQQEMAVAVGRSIAEQRHLVVQAGTGTGKSLAYLIPAALSDQRIVVATATKALQDQLAHSDLPMVAGALDRHLSFAVLKGRSNYLCRQRVSEIGGRGDQLSLQPGAADPPDADDTLTATADADGAAADDPVELGRLGEQVKRLVRWADDTTSGDRAELDFEPHFRAWAMVSTSARECPGAFRCPSGRDCFAEHARARAAEADVVVVNTHLYGAHLASGGAVLPPHEVVVFDEAHEVEEVMTDSLGADIGPGRFRALATSVRTLLDAGTPGAVDAVDAVSDVAELLHRALRPLVGRQVPRPAVQPAGPPRPGDESGAEPAADLESHVDPPALELGLAVPPPRIRDARPRIEPMQSPDDPDLGRVLELAAGRVGRVVEHLRQAEREAGDDGPASARSRRDRALLAAGHLATDLARFAALTDGEVAWVDGGPRSPSLRISPIDVGPLLSEQLWGTVTGVLTSATVPLGLADRLGLPPESSDALDVGSPFDYRHHALLYVAQSLPDRRRSESEPALHDELEILIEAAGGRTLALFTSWRAMNAAVEALRPRLPFPVLAQSDLPKPALIEAFRDDEATCLFATLGFWQGVDIPGRTVSMVTIDRIPFPRPDEPVLQARRDRAGPGAFNAVDLPRAGTLLAQGAGRLIRSANDRGVVAVLDSRLATARYRGALLARVPAMKRTVDRSEVEAFLRDITAGA
ncbi:MAG: ATP-dependent DNA helicase [Acidimicrobiales bacterium]|nr:ATP-dependent DNA helicase [Acidimicrobiales bacterium]